MRALPTTARASIGASDWKRTLAPWYLAEFLHSYGVTIYSTCVYFYAVERFGASPAQCLWLSAGGGLIYVFISLLAGHLSEIWGARRLLVRMGGGCAFTALAGLATLYLPAARSLWWLFLAMTAFNLTANQLWPAFESAVTRSPASAPLSRRVAAYNLTWASSSFAGFFCAPYVKAAGWTLVFVLPAGICLAAAGVVHFLAIRQEEIGPSAAQTEPEASSEAAAVKRRARTLLHMAWIGNAMSYVAIFVLIPVLPTIVRIAGVSTALGAAVLISVWTLARAAGFLLTWHWTGWHYSVRWMLGAYLLMAISFIVVLSLPQVSVVLLAAQALFGLAVALLYSSSLYYAMHVSSGAGGHAGVHEALIGLGAAVGPLAGALAGGGSTAAPGRIPPAIVLAVGMVLAAGFAAAAALGLRAGPRSATAKAQ